MGKFRALSSACPFAVSNSGTASVMQQVASIVSGTSNRSNERPPQNPIPRFFPAFVRPADQFITGVGVECAARRVAVRVENLGAAKSDSHLLHATGRSVTL